MVDTHLDDVGDRLRRGGGKRRRGGEGQGRERIDINGH